MTSYRYDKYGVWNDAPDDTDSERDRSLYLGRLDALDKHDERRPDDFVEIPYTTGSDYSGGSVTVSNYRAIWEDFKDKIPGLYQIYGGYGTYGLVVRRYVLESENDDCKELQDVIKALHNYPLYNEEIYSQVELEAENEAWDSWAKNDYRRALEKLETIPDDSEETISEDVLFETFRLVMDRINEYWENETGNSAYVDIERIAGFTTPKNIETARTRVAEYEDMAKRSAKYALNGDKREDNSE